METTTKTQSPSITIRRTFPVTPEKVWRALTESSGLKRWMAPSDDYAVPIAEADARIGGRYHLVMRSPDGEEHDVSGVYREVVLHRKLVYTWAWKSMPERESLVTIELRAAGGGTELTLLHQQFHDEAARDRHQQGWNGCLNRLQAHLSA
jgi:uncharacterized protein YndB with AHSA1/START domain